MIAPSKAQIYDVRGEQDQFGIDQSREMVRATAVPTSRQAG